MSPSSAAQKGVWPLRGPSYSPLSPSLSPIVGMNKHVLIDRYVISVSKDAKPVEDSTATAQDIRHTGGAPCATTTVPVPQGPGSGLYLIFALRPA
jgi:hypothetical protein